MFTNKYLYFLTFAHISLLSVPPTTETESQTRTATVRRLQTTTLYLGRQESVDTNNLRIEQLPNDRYQLWRISERNAAKMLLSHSSDPSESMVTTPEGRCVNEDFLKREYNQTVGADESIDVPVTPRNQTRQIIARGLH